MPSPNKEVRSECHVLILAQYKAEVTDSLSEMFFVTCNNNLEANDLDNSFFEHFVALMS